MQHLSFQSLDIVLNLLDPTDDLTSLVVGGKVTVF